MMRAEHRREELAWVVPVLEKALGNNSRIAQSLRAGELPTVFGLAKQSMANLGPDHPDREIAVVAGVYWAVGGLLLKVDPETSDRKQIVDACAELGCLGAWLGKAQPETLVGARCLLALAVDILDISVIAPESALARGPVLALLNNAGKAVNLVTNSEGYHAATSSHKAADQKKESPIWRSSRGSAPS